MGHDLCIRKLDWGGYVVGLELSAHMLPLGHEGHRYVETTIVSEAHGEGSLGQYRARVVH